MRKSDKFQLEVILFMFSETYIFEVFARIIASNLKVYRYPSRFLGLACGLSNLPVAKYHLLLDSETSLLLKFEPFACLIKLKVIFITQLLIRTRGQKISFSLIVKSVEFRKKGESN